MHFLRLNVTINDAVNMIHDVIRTAHPFPHTAYFMFVRVRNDKTQPINMLKDKQNTYIVLPYIKNI